MNNSILNIRFSGTDSNRSKDWVKLEQRDTGTKTATDSANYKDLYQMMAYAKSGKSAREYLYDNCPYAKIADEVLTVTLPFLVWPSGNDLNYSLSSTQGKISPPEAYAEQRNFDVIFNNTDSVTLPFMFSGFLAQEMPFFNSKGEQIFPTITINGSTITLSEAGTCVLRASGTAIGKKHSITLTLDVTPVHIIDKDTGKEIDVITGYNIEKLATTIAATWETGKDGLELHIPECVRDLVEVCGESGIVFRNKNGDDNEERYRVYYSTCDGSILREGWYGGDE